jgi:four helix bundle protein
MARNFRKILAWQKADDLVVELYKTTGGSFPKEERFGVTAQLRSAVVSVAANIAEGSGRRTPSDFRRFLYQAQGSLSEVEHYLHLTHRLGYLSTADHDRLEQSRASVGRVLSGLIRSVDRQIAESNARSRV